MSTETGKTRMQSARVATAKPSTTNRAKSTNNPQYVAGADNRSPWSRRRRDLVDGFVAALGGIEKLTEVQVTAVRRAAELTVIVEMTRARILSEGPGVVDLGSLVRLETAAGRAVRALALQKGPAATQPLSMRDRLLGADVA